MKFAFLLLLGLTFQASAGNWGLRSFESGLKLKDSILDRRHGVHNHQVGVSCVFPGFGSSLHLRGSGGDELASDVWEVKTDKGKPWMEDYNFTVFRHRKTGAAVEIVHDDDEMCMGFFRFMSSDIFDIVPDSPLFENFSHDCPGWTSFINAHMTGDFLQSQHIYHALANNSGTYLMPSEQFKVGNWTARPEDGGRYIVLQHTHPGCAGAQLILTPEGFTYLGRNDTFGWVTEPAKAIILEGNKPARSENISDARPRFEYFLGPELEHQPVKKRFSKESISMPGLGQQQQQQQQSQGDSYDDYDSDDDDDDTTE